MGRKVVVVGVVAITGALSVSSLLTAQQPQKELTEKEVIQLIKQSKGNLKSVAAVLEDPGG